MVTYRTLYLLWPNLIALVREIGKGSSSSPFWIYLNLKSQLLRINIDKDISTRHTYIISSSDSLEFHKHDQTFCIHQISLPCLVKLEYLCIKNMIKCTLWLQMNSDWKINLASLVEMSSHWVTSNNLLLHIRVLIWKYILVNVASLVDTWYL